MSSGNEQRCEASGGRKRGFSDVDSSSSESSDDEVTIGPRRKCFMIDEEEADSDDSINVTRKRRVARMSSSSSSSDDSYDNSDAEVIRIVRKKNTFKLASSEDDSSGWEDESATKSSKEIEEGSSSDSCDGQSEKCPICFIKFRNQEVGIPATCEHCFCVGCIQEWSKSVNTCPVDRKKFNQIRVRKCYNNKDYYKTIPVEEPTNDTFDDLAGVIDLTACEVCGSSEHEDRLLLCDSCDAAYHLDCLTPPLREVPVGNWFCEGCGFGDASDLMNFDLVQFDFLVSSSRSTRESFTTSRLIPRTRQSERIRTRIVYQRGQRQNLPVANEAGNQASVNDINQPGPSTSTRRRPRTTNKKVTKRRKTRKTKPAKYKITYEIDQTTGEKIAIKKKTRKYMRKRKKARKSKIKFKRVVVPKSVKERLAKQLGMCAPKTPGQTLPDVKVQTNLNNNIAIRRSQAGLPSLHLFAPRNELEYFSESESEVDGEGGGVNILVARRPNRSDVSVLRRAARNKANVAITPIATASTDLLGSILNSQAQLHSKNSALSLKRDGTVKIDVNKNVRKDSSDRSNGAINLGGADSYVHRRPMVPNTSGNEGGSCNANMNSSHPCDNRISNTVPTSTVEFSNSETSNNFGSNDNNDDMQDYSMHGHLDNYEIPQNSKDKQKKKEDKEEKEVPNGSPGNSGSELDIYSDIETVSTSKIDEQEAKCPTPPPPNLTNANLYDDNESESDLIIDTEKAESDKYDPMTMYESEGETTKEEETVTSTSEPVNVTRRNDFTSPTLSSEIQSETVQSSNQNEYYLCKSFADEEEKHAECDNEEPSDDCPNFSIYSAESINLAKNSELNIMMAQNEAAKTAEIDETPPSPVKKDEEKAKTKVAKKPPLKKRVYTGLYSDSEDESLIKINQDQPFGFSDIRNMTEDISEEERSYTPCLDEKEPSSLREGLAGLDTELISDDEKNDFEETQEMKTASDGDALEINAKESELDFTRPDECEEGEIIDKSKTNVDESVPEEVEKESKSEVVNNEEIESENKEPVFKKLSKSNKERNYRDKENKERERSKSKEKKDNKSKDKEIREREMRENNRRERQRKEKRREIARYNVRSLVETKPKKDKFGRDPAQRRSRSNTRKRTPSSSRSPSPTLRNPRDDVRRKSQSVSSDSSSSRRYGKDMRRKSYSTSRSRSPLRRSVSRGRKSYSPDRRKRRGRTASRSKSRGRKPRSRSRLRKRPRSSSRDRVKPRKRSNDKAPDKLKRKRKRDRSESRSPSRRREWVGRRRSREWSLSMSHSRSPEAKHFTPSWTPPRMMNQTVRPQNLTVILPNDSNKKKKDKKKKQEKKIKESATGGAPEKQKKRRRSERSPLPSKEVFASGNNILVSVSFNKDNNEVRTEKVRRKRDSNASEDLSTRRVRKENNPVKTPVKRKQRGKNVSNIKPVAIIDLDRSPFKELTPSPKDIIVLSDSDNGDSNDLMGLQNALNQQSPQQAASPEAANNSSYMNSMGPKTPPEPQVKFTFSSKQPQLRAISNPLHDPDDDREEELDPQEELENRLNEVTHKGPNTPPEPPNSPPSSPDAYDPFDPTKSRTPSPEPKQSNAQSSISQIIEDSQEEIEDISESIDLTEKNSPLQVSKSHTPPISVADIQPADSQSSVRAITPDTNQGSSPERPERTIGVVINQVVQSQSASLFPSSTPIAYSSSSTSLITSTPVSSNLTVPRINILSSSILTPPVVTSSVSQRSLIPNTTKASPINKVSPSKAPAKSSASKGSSKIPTKNANWKNKNRSNENNDSTNLDLDSPYSPGSSDYEDLFEPPPETGKSAPTSKTSTAATTTASKTTSSGKGQNAFDVLFGTSPAYANKKPTKTKSKPKKSTHHTGKGTKQVGVKLDEDNLKILDELPNSAVEMQVKDKFLKKLNRQERVVEEVKFVLKPYYNKKRITKEEYKDILRRAVPKICHNKSGEINPQKIQQLIEAYVKKSKHSKKVTSSSSTVNPQKTEVVSNWLSKLN